MFVLVCYNFCISELNVLRRAFSKCEIGTIRMDDVNKYCVIGI